MIKVLKLSNKSVTRFNTNKKWKYSTLNSGSSIILEQGDNIPLFSSSVNTLSTEQNDSEFKLNMRIGKKVTGTFFSKDSKHFNKDKEPLNYDGSYQRVVYNSVKHLFYNEYGTIGDSELDQYYKNPLNIFGSETGIYSSLNFNSKAIENDKRSERRVLKDEVTLLEIPAGVFGEKIKPGTLKITDHSSDFDSIKIEDDGNTNLVVGSDTFNSVSEINLNTFFTSITESSSTDAKLKVDYTDLSYGHSLDSHGDFLIVGAPILSSSPSENQSGRASLHKYNNTTKKHEIIKNFYCPFTQNGIARENTNDNCQFILSELGDIISNENLIVNDNFGKSVAISDTICAIGSPNSHINGRNTDQSTGHIFVYDKNKGGKENWGIINVFEGLPDSEFGESVSVDNDYIAVGSPNFDNGIGCVYIFKKTKRTKEHPWIKTSSVYDSYKWNESLGRYEGLPKQNDNKYKKYLKQRDEVVSRRILNLTKELQKLRDTGQISDADYISSIPVKEDYSEIYPYNYLYGSHETECESDVAWYKQRVWSKQVHPAVRCKFAEEEKHFKKSVWPGFVMDVGKDLYIPNPDHEQNENNKWAYRWKIQNIVGGAEGIKLFGDESCDDIASINLFSDSSLNSFGDSSDYPLVEYSETPEFAVGDTTFDLVGTIHSPNRTLKRFGEKVVIKGNKLYASTHSTNEPRCYMFVEKTNQHGCLVWELKNTITDVALIGHSVDSKLDENIFEYAQINHFDTYFEIEICPRGDDYSSWMYSFDTPILNAENEISSGTRVERCSSVCKDKTTFNYYSRFQKINNNSSAHLPANYGEFVNLPIHETNDDNAKYYTKSKLGDSFYHHSENSIGISWKNVRENVSFAYTNVEAGLHPNFMSIYSNEGKLDNGTYDPLHILAEIGAQETLNGKLVRLVLNSGQGDSEKFYEFLFRGSYEGTHYTLNELVNSLDYDCTLPPNLGTYVSISDIKFKDPLGNKSKAKFFSKKEKAPAYKEPWSADDILSISWKNFRENVSFSYPSVKTGNHPAFMTIYSNEAKQRDGTYDPIHTLAEIGGCDTLNGKKVRLTFNTGFVDGDEYYYEFIFKGTLGGTHYTLNELKDSIEYDCTLPPNIGEGIDIPNEKFNDPLNNELNARFYTKRKDQLSYTESWGDENSIALSWRNFRENVSFSYPSVKKGNHPSFMAIYSNEAKNEDGTYDPMHLLAEVGAQETLNGHKVRLTFNTGFVGGDEYYYEFIYRGSIEGTHYTLNELRNNITENFAETTPNSGVIRYIHDYQDINIMKRCRLPKFFTKAENQLSYVEPFSDDSKLAISWKNFRENISFSYPNIDAGTQPSFMTIYSDGAKTDTGKYNPMYILGEIGATNTLNGKLVKLIINADNCKNDKTRYYEFIYRGSIEGTHYTLSELKNKVEYDCTLPPNLGDLVKLSDLDSELKSENAYFYSKPDGGLSYTEDYSDDTAIGLSWKNFRENVSFSYPSVKKGNHPSFMAIYSNDAKNADGTYDPLKMLAEIGAQETLDGNKVRLTLNTGFVGGDEYYYEFIYRGSIQGTHYTLNELSESLSDFDCTLPPNMGSYVSIADKDFEDSLNNKSNAKLFSKGENAPAYNEPWSDSDTMSISWKNVRENVSFSYPRVKVGNKPCFMSIYSNEAKTEDGSYDPLHIIAEIGSQETLNGNTVRLTFNTGFEGGNEYYYEFVYVGSAEGTHFTLNELKQSFEYECTLRPNQGEYVSLSDIDFTDFLLNNKNAKFFTKGKDQPAHKENINSDEVSVGWKNFRENVSFSYPSVKSGPEPSFMTIYANGAKDKKGRYDPIKTLAEISADTGLNGKKVRLTFNTGSVNDDEFYYEFKYDGSLAGKHYTLNELAENNLLIKVESSEHLHPTYPNRITSLSSEKIRPMVIEPCDKKDVSKLAYKVASKLNSVKSFGMLPENYGEHTQYDIKLQDDILQSDGKISFYKRKDSEKLYKENTNIENEIEIDWKNAREGVSFYYPMIRKSGSETVTMKIYGNQYEDTKDENTILIEISADSALNGEIVRLHLKSKNNKNIFYEFIFDGTEVGTTYTLNDLSQKVSEQFGKPLIVHSPELENCKIKIEKNFLSRGLHQLYLLLIDNFGEPIGETTRIEMYNNPSLYSNEERRNLVKKTYTYSKEIKSEFGKSIDASDNYFIIGNPSDRKYFLNSIKSCTSGSVYVYGVGENTLSFIEKVYGEDDFENEFSSGFGTDVSIRGSSFLVGGHSYEMSNITLDESSGLTKLQIEDFEFGATKYSEEMFDTTEALITDYEIDLNSDVGDAVVKIKVDGLNINESLLDEITLSAGFIDTGNETLRIANATGEGIEKINGVFRLMQSPINVESGCEIDLDDITRVYMNSNNWSIYYDKLRSCWILTDTPNVSVEYLVPKTWQSVLDAYEQLNTLSKFSLLTEDTCKLALNLYNITDHTLIEKWKSRVQKSIPSQYVGYVHLIRELESVSSLKLNKDIITEIFYLYNSNSRKKLDISILKRWTESDKNLGILPFVYELDSVNPISLNFDLLLRTLEIYMLKDYEILKSWSVKLGYDYLVGDLLEEISPEYHENLSLQNLRTISKIATDFIENRNYIKSDNDIHNYFKITLDELKNYTNKWKSHVDVGFLLSDVFKDMNDNININFMLSNESSVDDLPMKFNLGVGMLSNQEIIVNSNNDTAGNNSSLTWGVYRDATKLVGNYIHLYVNLLPDAKFDSTLVFIYNSIKSAVNGYAYYYTIDKDKQKCIKLKRMKTNKTKYSCKRQYGHSVSLSKNFICVGSPVLGNFNIDEITTFGGNSLVSFGSSEKMFIEYNSIDSSYISDLGKSTVGSVITYDHSAIRDNKKHYIGNVFYKNGMIALTDRTGYFKNVLSNSGTSGFELEFKSMHTLYENEILCRVEPHEFNFSTNPSSVKGGLIQFDINEDGKFDIIDASYIYKYIMGEVGDIEMTDEEIIENETSIKLSDSNNWPTQDILMTESEDALLMDLFFSSNIIEKRPMHELLVKNLKEKFEAGEFDINGDGKTDEVDANLLLRYFVGRRGTNLTRNLTNRFTNETRSDSVSIVKYLDEKTGKNLGKEILKDFQDFSENDKKDSTGSYLAPYATTIGLYSGLELAMVAKLGKPVKILPNYPINFLIKFDN